MTEPSLGFICLMGVGVVFIGLIILVGLVYLMNYLCDKFVKDKKPVKAQEQKVVASQDKTIPNREELVAAICAAIAEEEGTDISAIRVLSIEKVN